VKTSKGLTRPCGREGMQCPPDASRPPGDRTHPSPEATGHTGFNKQKRIFAPGQMFLKTPPPPQPSRGVPLATARCPLQNPSGSRAPRAPVTPVACATHQPCTPAVHVTVLPPSIPRWPINLQFEKCTSPCRSIPQLRNDAPVRAAVFLSCGKMHQSVPQYSSVAE